MPHDVTFKGSLFIDLGGDLIAHMNLGETFIIFEDSEGKANLLNKQHVVAVRDLEGKGHVPKEEDELGGQQSVSIAVTSGRIFSGVMPLHFEDRPHELLNEPEKFFELNTPDGLLVVNKNAIVKMLLPPSKAEGYLKTEI